MPYDINEYAVKKAAVCTLNDSISPRLYKEYGVNLGLRDINGKGVLTGLTNVSKITSSKIENGKKVPCEGELWYRGYSIETLIKSLGEEELGFEKIAYLLLLGELPSKKELLDFCEVIGNSRTLPTRSIVAQNLK